MSLSSSVLSARMFQQIDDVSADKAGKREEKRICHRSFTRSESSIDKLVEINNKLTTNHVPLKYGTNVSFYRFPN